MDNPSGKRERAAGRFPAVCTDGGAVCAGVRDIRRARAPIRKDRRDGKTQILVDADACPVKEIILRQAKKKNIPVTMVIDTSHELHDGYSTVVTVDKARDSADIKLVNLVRPGDVVVTQDFGLAAMALARGASALNQNGLIYSAENMDRLLFERHLGQKIRRAGGRTNNPKKRTKRDDAVFEEAFLGMIG